MNRFSQNLKFLREQTNLKQIDLAKKLNISSAAYSNYETGRREPNIEILLKISNLFNVSIDDIITKNDLSLIDYIIKEDENNALYNIENFNMISILKEKQNYYLEKKISINKLIDSQLNKINYWINQLETTNLKEEIAEELAPNIINFPNNEVNYRIINIAGNVSAGNPCYAYEDITDTLKISSNLLCDSKDYFALRIKGDSMNLLFDDGELILVEQSTLVSNDDIVIALIYDDATVKKFKFDSDSVYLIPQSSNPIHQIQTYNKNQVYILGKVVGKISDFQKKDE